MYWRRNQARDASTATMDSTRLTVLVSCHGINSHPVNWLQAPPHPQHKLRSLSIEGDIMLAYAGSDRGLQLRSNPDWSDLRLFQSSVIVSAICIVTLESGLPFGIWRSAYTQCYSYRLIRLVTITITMVVRFQYLLLTPHCLIGLAASCATRRRRHHPFPGHFRLLTGRVGPMQKVS